MTNPNPIASWLRELADAATPGPWTLAALAPALARGYAEAVDVLQADGHGQWKARLCRLSGRKNEYCDGCRALAHAEELRGVVTT